MITADINRAQFVLLAQCLLFGVGAGLVYDVFRALRRGGAGEGACDALFCAVTLAAAFRFGLVSAAGQWRLFALAGAAAGGAIYFALLSGFAMPVFGGAVRTLKSTLNRGRGALRWCVSRADSEKIRDIRKKVCKTLFTFSRKRYKIKSKSVQRQER